MMALCTSKYMLLYAYQHGTTIMLLALLHDISSYASCAVSCYLCEALMNDGTCIDIFLEKADSQVPSRHGRPGRPLHDTKDLTYP